MPRLPWLAIFFCGLLAIPPALAEKRVALVIGNGAYQHAPALTNPRNDAEGMAAALKRLGFDVTLGVDLDKAAADRLLEAFERKLDGAEVALFFYAGHGLQVNGRNFLVPVDAKLEREAQLNFQAVSLDLVQTLMEQAQRTNVIILDACRDNPLARTLARSMGTRSTAIGNGLAGVQGGRGTLIVYATQPGNVALDGKGRNSPFTTALLEHIETPGLEVRQVLTRVRASVTKATGDKQLPWEATSLIGDFYFAPKAAADKKPAPPPAPGADQETVFWQSIKDSKSTGEFRAYLERWPNGVFAPLARARIAELERAAAEESKRREEQRKKTADDERADAERKAREEAKKRAEEKAKADAEAKKRAEQEKKKADEAKSAEADARKRAQIAASWYAAERRRGLVAFAHKKATLEPGAVAALEKLVASLQARKDYKIVAFAAADGSEGPAAEQQALSRARLAAIQQWLAGKSIPATNLRVGVGPARGEGPEHRTVSIAVEAADVEVKPDKDVNPRPPEPAKAVKMEGLAWNGVVPPSQVGMTKGAGYAVLAYFKAGGVLEVRITSYGLGDRQGGPVYETWFGTWSAGDTRICVDLAKIPEGKGCYAAAVDSDGRVTLTGAGFFNGKRFAR